MTSIKHSYSSFEVYNMFLKNIKPISFYILYFNIFDVLYWFSAKWTDPEMADCSHRSFTGERIEVCEDDVGDFSGART